MPKLIMEFTIPGIPPSYSASFKINYGLRQTYLSSSARKFKTTVKVHMPSHKVAKLKLKPTDRLIMHNEYHQDWYFKNRKIKKQDCQNLNRLLIDAVFKGLGIDDSCLFAVVDEKIQNSKKKETVVKLYIDNGEKDYKNDK